MQNSSIKNCNDSPCTCMLLRALMPCTWASSPDSCWGFCTVIPLNAVLHCSGTTFLLCGRCLQRNQMRTFPQLFFSPQQTPQLGVCSSQHTAKCRILGTDPKQPQAEPRGANTQTEHVSHSALSYGLYGHHQHGALHAGNSTSGCRRVPKSSVGTTSSCWIQGFGAGLEADASSLH